MKLLSSHLVVPAFLAALSSLAACSSDNSGAGNSAGSSPGGANGKAGSAGSSVGGAGAAGAAAAVAGGGAGGASAGASSTAGTSAGGTGGLGAAGGGTAGGVAIEASFAMVKDMINATCFGNGCHSQEGNPLQMKIDDKLYGTLTTHVTENCGKLINTASPADSAIVKLLKADCGTAPKITPRMPWDKCFDGDVDSDFCVSPAKIAAIQAWIAKGAPPQ